MKRLALVLVGCGSPATSAKPEPPAVAPAVDAGATDDDGAMWLDGLLAREYAWLDEAVRVVERDQMLVRDLGCAGHARCGELEGAKAACRDGDADACVVLATAYHLGEGVAQDWRRAAHVAAIGCHYGHAAACLHMANEIDLMDGSTFAEREVALGIYFRQCWDDDVAWACFGLARSVMIFTKLFDVDVAREALDHGCELEPDGDLLCRKAECLREDPPRNLFDCR